MNKMRTVFIEPTVEQLGGSAFPVYRGLPYQRGEGLGSVFKSVLRFLLPIGKAVGKEALNAGLGVAADALQGEDIKKAARKRGAQALRNTAEHIQEGEGLGKPGKKPVGSPIKGDHKRKRASKKSIPLGLYYGSTSAR